MRLHAYARKMGGLARRPGLRFLLGMAQMLAAGTAIVMLVSKGINPTSLLAATIASVLTMASVLIFRK